MFCSTFSQQIVASRARSFRRGKEGTRVSTKVDLTHSCLTRVGASTNMGMTGSTNKDFGTITKQTQVKITNATHPLAAGLSGTVTVLNVSGTMSWGKPNANAVAIATAATDSTKTLIFGYASGAAMPGLTAPARRVGLFMNDTSAASFNSNGDLLFDTAVKWATGRL